MAGTINLANVALGFDASKVVKGVDMSAGELRKLNGIFRDSIAPVDRYNADLNILRKGYDAGAISADRYKQALASLNDKYKQGLSSGSGGASSGELKSMLAQYASMAAGFAGVKKSLSLAATAESNKISLEVLTGSVAKAKMLFDGFVELDRNSPLSRSSFSDAAQKLIGFGYAAESTLPALKRLSEISIGNAEKFQSLSLAFGQVNAAGRLMGQEVLQMVNAGFNPLQEISRTTGRSMIELKKAMEDGLIPASMVADAIESATSEGGRFYEMNERLKDSAAGQWSKMQSDVEMLATEIGTNLLPAAKAFMDLMKAGGDSSGQGGFLPSIAQAFATGLEADIALQSDIVKLFRGGKDNTSSVFGVFDRIQTEEMTKRILAENVHVKTQEEKERIAKNMAASQAKERAELEAIAKKEKDALEEKKKADKEAKAAEKKAAREHEAEVKRLIKETKDAENERIKQAEKLAEKTLKPLEEYKAEVKRINSLFESGNIKTDVRDRGINKAGEKLIKDGKDAAEKMDPQKLSQTIAPALRAGSVEAYKFMLNQKDKLYEAAQEQKQVSTETLSVAKQQLTAIQAIPKIGVKR